MLNRGESSVISRSLRCGILATKQRLGSRASRLRRQFIADRGFGLDGSLHRGPCHHARVMSCEVGKCLGGELEGIREPPIQPKKMDVDDRIVSQRPARTKTPV